MRALAILAIVAAVAVPVFAADAEATALLERARYWQARARDDLAREEVEKAIRLAPADPDALLMLGQLQLRANQDREAAATLERLRSAKPDHPGVKQLATALRVRGPDKDRLRQARQLKSAGRTEEAMAAYRALFPDGFPDDELALEYAQLVAATRNGWEPARASIAQLARKHPDDPRFQVALASHMSTRKPVSAETLRALKELSNAPSVPVSRQAREAWRRAVLAMDPVEQSLPSLRDYVASNPGETAVAERLDEVVRAVEQEKRVRADPGLRARREGLAALEAGRDDEAARLLQEAVEHYPKDAEAVGSLGIAKMRQAKLGEAGELFQRAARLEPAASAKWSRLAATSRYWLLMREAVAAREAGALDAAESKLHEAQALDPDEGSAAKELARVRSTRLREQATRLQAQGRLDDALAALEAARAIEPDDPWMTSDLARLHAARGEPQRGEALFTQLLARQPRDGDTRFAMALYLSSLERESEALAVLEAVEPGQRSAAMTRLQRRLWITVQGRRAAALAAQPDGAAQAQAILDGMRATAGRDTEAAMVYARTLGRMERDVELRAWLAEVSSWGTATPAQAEEIARMQRSLAQQQRFGEARQLRSSGRPQQAESIYRAMLADNPAEREAERALADTLMDRGAWDEARPIVNAAVAASPDEARVLAQAGRLAVHDGRVDAAVAYEQRSMALEPRQDEGWRYRRLAELLDRQRDWYATGIDSLYRSGTAGKSRIGTLELPLAWRSRWTESGEWSLRVAPAHVNSGLLDAADTAQAQTFGSMLLCLPLCEAAPLVSVKNGVALAAAFERDGWRVDLGTSPIGFPVVNAVGGVARSGDWGPVSYTVEALRRALPSSLLSYAGSRDPNTGRTWGGVVTNGLRLNVSRDSGGDYGAWGVAGIYRLTGRNVLDNDKGELMGGLYRRLVNEPDRQLVLGLSGMLWRFSENAGEFTFGHGGYYSPKDYRSLTLPLTYGARSERTSFTLRGSVSVAWSESRRAPYFPTDADLQAQAEALSAVNGVDPFYAAGNNGRSYGRSLSGVVEHQLAPGIFIGGRLDLERSTNYTPSRFLLYVRFTPDGPAARPVSLPPEAPYRSYSY